MLESDLDRGRDIDDQKLEVLLISVFGDPPKINPSSSRDTSDMLDALVFLGIALALFIQSRLVMKLIFLFVVSSVVK